MKLKELENTIACLPPEELARFREWFMEFDAEQLDRRIQGDADNGRLDALAESALKTKVSGTKYCILSGNGS